MRRSSAGAVFLTVVVDLVGFGIVLPLLPRYARDYDASGAEIGMLMACFSAMQLLFAPVWGRISDRVGRRPVLLVGLAGSVVFYSVFALADSLAWLFVARIGAGIAGATISISAAYIADVTGPAERARGMALIGAAFGIGFTVGPPIGGYSVHLGQVLAERGVLDPGIARGLPGLVAAALSLVSFLWTFAAVAEPERHRAEPRRLLDLDALRGSAAVPGVSLLLLFSFLSVFSFSNLEGTLSLMLHDRFLYDERSMGLVFLFIGFSLALAQGLLVRRLVRRFGERTFVRAGLALMSLGLIGIAAADGLPLLLPSLAVAVTGFGAVTPSLSSLVSQRAHPERQGAMMGLAQSVSALGRILGPFVGNVVYEARAERTGPAYWLECLFAGAEHHRRPYLVAAAILAAMAIASAALPRSEGGPESGAGGGS